MAGKKTAQSPEEKLARALVPQEEWPYELPKGWVWTRVGDINKSQAKSCTPKNEPSQNFEMYSVPSYAENYPEILKGKEIGSSKQLVQKDDILLCKINPRINRVWKVSRFTDNPLLASSEWIVIRNNTLLPDYLMWYFRSSYFREYMLSNVSGVGGSLMRAQPKFVKTYPIPLPPLPEQQRIVDKIQSLFARLDEARDKLQQVLEGTEARRAAILHEAFSGGWGTGDSEEGRVQSEEGAQEADGTVSVPEGWKKSKVRDICKHLSYGTSKKSSSSGKYVVIRMGNLQDGLIDWENLAYTSDESEYEKYKLNSGDVLFNRTNSPELVGKTSIYQGEYPAIYAGYLIKLDYDRTIINGEYLNFYLNSPRAKHYCNLVKTDGVNQSNINSQKIGNFEIVFPPLKEQVNIVSKLNKVFNNDKNSIKMAQSALAQIDLLKKAILARAFRGELGTGDSNDPSALDLLEQSL